MGLLDNTASTPVTAVAAANQPEPNPLGGGAGRPPEGKDGRHRAKTISLPAGHTWEPVDGKLLEVRDLQVEFRMREGVAKAINGVSFDLSERETLAILGESGSGKSVTAQAVMGILDTPPGYVTGGEVRYCGVDLLRLPEKQRQKVRGAEIAMIFQDALSALNPVFPVGWQIAEMFRKHRGANR
ncbi:MAG: ATP-binding cassette domain-containing protein, partial [Propionicimonas sp.]|nr:ATP-binding cassette domain-containing protein [Propionicimonas sp.]